MKKEKRKVVMSSLMACLIISTSVATTKAEVNKYNGVSSYETAGKLTDLGWTKANIVILASGESANLVDSLTVAPLSRRYDAPVIYTKPGKTLPEAIIEKLKTLGVQKVYIATGTGVLSEDIVKQLNKNGFGDVQRLGGKDRYETSINIAKEMGIVDKVVIASANDKNLVDSLSIASIAATKNIPIILSDPSKLSEAATKYIKSMPVKTSYIMGGPTLLTDSLLNTLPGNKKRLYGKDRYKTNYETVKEFNDGSIKFDKVFVASGRNESLIYPLLCAPLAAKNYSPVVLVDGTIDEQTIDLLQKNSKVDTNFITVGLEDKGSELVMSTINDIQQKMLPLQVKDISLLNLKQIQIKFNKALDKDSVENINNYEIYDDGSDTSLKTQNKAELQKDNQTVLFTIDPKNTTCLTNMGTGKLVIKGNVKDSYGNAMGNDYTEAKMKIQDITRPNVLQAMQSGPNKIKIYFSEPVRDASDILKISGDNFLVDAGGYTVTDGVWDILGNFVEVTLNKKLSDGQHSLVINPSATSDLVDFAGLKVPQKSSIMFNVKNDTTAPVATIKSATDSSVTFKFNKPINYAKSANIAYRHTVNSSKNQILGNSENVIVNADGTEVTVNFGAEGIPVTLGNTCLYISYLNNVYTDNNMISDEYGNILKETTLSTTVAADTVKPIATVALVPNTNNMIDITYNEPVVGADISYYYTLKDYNGKYMIVKAAKQNNFVYRLTTNEAMSGTYTLKIESVKDTASTPNVIEPYYTSLEVADTLPPSIADSNNNADSTPNFYVQGDNKIVKIYFSESIKAEDLKNLSLYQNTGDKNANPISVVAAADGKSVILTFQNPVTSNLLVGQLRDLAGNKIQSLATVLTSSN